jgi:hypothetical protein
MGDLQPSEARTVYLNGKAPEEKAAILERAAQIGPGPEDADWGVMLACDDAVKAISKATAEAASAIATAAGGLSDDVALLAPMSAAVKEMASDLSRLRASVSRGKAPGYWTLYAMVCLGLVLALIVAGLAEHFGLQGNRQLYVTEGGIAVLSWSAVALAAVGAGVTWLLTRP